MIEKLKDLFGRYPELLLAWDDAKNRAHEAMVRANNKDHISVLEANLQVETAATALEMCKHDAASAWMWGFRCAMEHYPELRTLLNELLPTPRGKFPVGLNRSLTREVPMADSKKPPATTTTKRTPPSPDIQALARIDRILSGLPAPVAERTLSFLVSKYQAITLLVETKHEQLGS